MNNYWLQNLTQGPLIPANVAVEAEKLPSNDDITSCDNEIEQNDVASDENTVSGSDCDDDWIYIVDVSHDFMQWTLQYVMFVSNGLNLCVVYLNITAYLLFFVNCQMCEKLIHIHTCVIILWIDLDVDYIYLAVIVSSGVTRYEQWKFVKSHLQNFIILKHCRKYIIINC